MKVRRYWAWVPVTARDPDGPQEATGPARVWGGSDTSEEHAREVALRNASAWKKDPEKSPFTTGHSSWYEYAERIQPEPMIDEILNGEQRAGAITINRHGVMVLNTARLAFIDIDQPPPSPASVIGSIARLFGGRSKDAPARPAWIDRALKPLHEWLEADHRRAARVYATAKGLRVMIPTPPLDPAGDEVQDLMDACGADLVYSTMCEAQRSFRARLSPKPWRIGMRAAPVIDYETYTSASGEVISWLERYEHAREGYAVCQLIETIGPQAPLDETTARLVTIHDDMCAVGVDFPLA